MELLQGTVDLTSMFEYLKDYSKKDKSAIYILPDGFELDFEKIKGYFGEATSLHWERTKWSSIVNRYLALDLLDGVHYKIFPPNNHNNDCSNAIFASIDELRVINKFRKPHSTN